MLALFAIPWPVITLLIFFLSFLLDVRLSDFLALQPYLHSRVNWVFNINTAPVVGILALWASQCLTIQHVWNGLIESAGAQPYNIFLSHISLKYLIYSLDQTGLFEYLPIWASERRGTSLRKIALYLWVLATVAGIASGKLILILAGTVSLVYSVASNHFRDHLTELTSKFAAASVANVLLCSVDPMNGFISKTLGMEFASVMGQFFLPLAGCNLFSFMLARESITTHLNSEDMSDTRSLPLAQDVIRDRVGAIVGVFLLGASIVVVTIMNHFQVGSDWKIMVPFAAFKLAFDFIRDRQLTSNIPSLPPHRHHQSQSCRTHDTETRATLSECEDSDGSPPPDPKRSGSYQSHSTTPKHFSTAFSALERIQFSNIAFALSQCILIEVLEHHHWVDVFGGWLQGVSGGQLIPTIWIVGTAATVLCGITRSNVGATIFLTRIIHRANLHGQVKRGATLALLVASNLHLANMTFAAIQCGLSWRAIMDQGDPRETPRLQWDKKKGLLPQFAMTCVGLAIATTQMTMST